MLRVGAGLLTLVAVSFLIFVATNALPGNVAEVVLGRDASPEQVSALESELGLDQPFIARYWDWLSAALHGDLGYSTVQQAQGTATEPVTQILASPLVNSLILALISAVIVIPLAMLLGTVAAMRAGRSTDTLISTGALVTGSLPEFVFGTLLVAVFFSWLDVLPPLALVPPGSSPLADPQALILPVLTLVGVAVAFGARQVRVGVMHALDQDYVTFARMNGVPERRILIRYGLRNALAPSVQTFAQTIQYLFGGIVVVEALFAYPGIGLELVRAVALRDVGVVQAIAIILAAIYIAINIAADLLVIVLVPKLKTAL